MHLGYTPIKTGQGKKGFKESKKERKKERKHT
jgi:hypothetical protein